jgi:hypothetical protein
MAPYRAALGIYYDMKPVILQDHGYWEGTSARYPHTKLRHSTLLAFSLLFLIALGAGWIISGCFEHKVHACYLALGGYSRYLSGIF